ncbi:MAG: cytochrome c oxidase subunit 3 [Bacteroidota bacterium]|nr:cytochrome c oxidase subunit 3 [Bacteroidota bacterium]MDQ6889280.1 cytochrome c oxidase subunit 3 [Bacteroidota bacterium]
MIALMNEQKNRIHPHKFTLWIALASIVMMFAGFTSAYIIKRNLSNWMTFDLPGIFWYSTAVIIFSSITILLSRNAFRQREMQSYRRWLLVTLILGILFVFMQYIGFRQLWENGLTLTRNVSFSFLYIIVGLHALHVLAGVIALIVILIRAFSIKRKNYNIVPIDLMNTYWHFVDFLWIYLLVFLVMIR